jgi:AraC-like DNA-binding protein
LLTFTLLLAAIPVFSIGMLSYYIASRDIEEKVNEGNVQILLQNQMRLEQMLRSVELAAVQYTNSSLVKDTIYSELTYDDFQIIGDLAKGLYNLQVLPGVANTYLVKLQEQWMISNLGFKTTEDYPDREGLSHYSAHPQNLFWIAPGSDNPDMVRLVIKLPMISTTAEPKALLIVEMSRSDLDKTLTSNTQLGNIYVLNKERSPFLDNPDSQEIPTPILEKLRAAGEEQGQFTEDASIVNYIVSPYNNWSYVSIVSLDAVTKESKKIAVITLNACLIIFIAIAAIAFFGSRRMYSPIRRLSHIMEQLGGEPIDLKRQDEFAVIQDRYQALFSMRKQLQQQLQGQTPQMREFFLMKLFLGQITEDEFVHKGKTYGFTYSQKTLGVLVLQIDTLQDTRYRESDKELLLFAINNIVGEVIAASQMVGTLLLDQSQVTLLTAPTNDANETKAYFHDTAEQIRAKVHEFLQLQASIGVSQGFVRYTDAMNAYAEALEALKHRISLGNDIILHYGDNASMIGTGDNIFGPLKHLEDVLLNALKSGDAASALGYYDQYVAAIMERSVQFNNYQILMVQLIARIYGLVQQQGETLENLIGSNSVVNQFMKLRTVQDISAWFKKELLPPTLVFLRQRFESQYTNTALQMVQMIHDQFDQDISLESCAAQLNFNPVYLSRVFKKEIGVTFIDYLTDYRIRTARQWLEETDLKIVEIAERLNYTTSTGFIRSFRKLTGMTPGQYRDTHTKSK